MKRYIRTNKYLTEDCRAVFDDTIKIDIDVDLRWLIAAATNSFKRFPGISQFKEDVLNILEAEYNFEVIEDIYDGTKQKGYITNRQDSCSVYFDTFYDISNAYEPMKRLGIQDPKITGKGQIFCFIHIRFSDHMLNDDADINHNTFLKQNSEKYTHQKSNIALVINQEDVILNERNMQYFYDEALDELRDALDTRISYWARAIGKKIELNERFAQLEAEGLLDD